MNPKIELVKGGRKVDNKFQLNPEVSANDLTTPPVVPTLSQPKIGTLPNTPLVKNVAGETQNIIAAKTQEAADLAKLRQENAAFMNEGSLSDLFQTKKDEYGVDDTFKELKDINLQLSDANTASEMTKTKISGAEGQTLAQGQREVTQEDREAAVRNSGLAARAAVLQGNLETATALATQAVQIAYQDRTFKQQNLLSQLNDLSGVVDKQTQQLVDQAKVEAEEELRQIERLEGEISNAMVNGASASEIAQLTGSQLDDASKLSLAQSITARGAGEMRGLDIASKQANIAANYASIENVRSQIADRVATRILEEQGATEEEAQGVQEALSVKSLLDNLSGNAALGAATGKDGVIRNKIPGSEEFNVARTHDQLISALSLDNLSALKGLGAMSDREFSTIRNAATKLDLGLSETDYTAELSKINSSLMGTFERAVDKGIMTEVEFGALIGLADDDIAEVSAVGSGMDESTIASFYNQ